jgi:hypothetical protein
MKHSSPRCEGCAVALVVTRDAIGRPRYRCPQHQRVAPPTENTGVDLPLHNQTVMSSRDLAWPGPLDPRETDEARLQQAHLRRVARALSRAPEHAPLKERSA